MYLDNMCQEKVQKSLTQKSNFFFQIPWFTACATVMHAWAIMQKIKYDPHSRDLLRCTFSGLFGHGE